MRLSHVLLQVLHRSLLHMHTSRSHLLPIAHKRRQLLPSLLRILWRMWSSLTSPGRRAARLQGLDAEYAERGFRAARRGKHTRRQEQESSA